jgi:hypothetical protein
MEHTRGLGQAAGTGLDIDQVTPMPDTLYMAMGTRGQNPGLECCSHVYCIVAVYRKL